MLYSNSKRVELERMSAEVVTLKDRVLGYQETVKSLQGSLKSAQAAKARQKESYEAAIAEKDAIIKELKNKLAHASAVADRNGTNTGMPTASTPISRQKTIPNTRKSPTSMEAACRLPRSRSWQPGMSQSTRSVCW